MNKFLFLVIPNNNGSTILYKYLSQLDNFVSLLNHKGESDEGEKLIFRKYKTIEESPMPVPAYYEPHNPNINLHENNGNPIVPGLGRIWGSVNHEDIFGNSELFDWSKIKDEWLNTWKENNNYNEDSVLLEKSPTNPLWAPMLQKEFENSYYIISIRNPYAVCAGIRRRIKLSQNSELDIRQCILHWIETAKLQIQNISELKNSIWFTYEDLCKNQSTIKKDIKKLLPDVKELDLLFQKEVDGKDYGGAIENRNSKAIKDLSDDDIDIINTYLEDNMDLLEFFNYRLIKNRKVIPIEKSFNNKKYEISILQNFICTKRERLELIRKNLPVFAKLVNPYPVVVNYDTDIFAEEVYSLYKEHIENLHFRQNLNQEWGVVIKESLSYTNSPYIMYLCEDIIFNPELSRNHFYKIFEEYKINNCKHMLMGKVEKYRQSEWHESSNKGEHLWLFHSKDCPYFNLSSDALFERDFFEKIVEDSIGIGKGLKGLMYGIEQAGIRHRNIMCSVPLEKICNEEHPDGNISERYTSPTLIN